MAVLQGDGLLRSVLDRAAVGMALLDEAGHCLYANSAFGALFGFETQESIDQTLAAITHPDDRGKLGSSVEAGEGIERRYVRKDGTAFHGLTSISALGEAAAGTPFRFVLQIVDIEAQKQAELQLAENEWRWNNALLGNTETAASGTVALGAMIGARGCIEAIDTVNQVYRVTVAWQGLVKTVVPSLPCGSGNFGSDGYRRAISVQVRMGVLS